MTVFDARDFDAHEGVHFFDEPSTGFRAIIAIHSTHLGPSAGGCRYWTYASDTAALTDALRLSRGMSYKNAMAGLPMGGGKAVILRDAAHPKDEPLLEAFGSAVNSLGGAYVTAEDVGISDADMVVASRKTRFVSGLPVAGGQAGGNPGPSTAEGVLRGMRAAVKHKLGKGDFAGLHIAIQGLGSVGYALARKLHTAGATLTVADINADRVAAAADEFGARTVSIGEILRVPADVLSPCALGAVLTAESIALLDVAVIAGAANNQLATAEDGWRLHARGILYAPDYVVNAGGIINVVAEYLGDGDAESVLRRIAAIEGRLADIFVESDRQHEPTDSVADAMARKLIGRGQGISAPRHKSLP